MSQTKSSNQVNFNMDMLQNYIQESGVLSRTSPIMETAFLIGMTGVIFSPDIIVYMFKLLIAINVILSGVTISSFIVANYIYKKEEVEDTDGYESEVDENYEDKYNIDFRALGFPEELVDNEPEEKGYEV